MINRQLQSPATPATAQNMNRAQQANQAKQAQLAIRQRYVQSLFGGGPANRYLLSLRSGIPAEVDHALEVLVQYSYSDAVLMPLEHLHGLAAALLDIVRPSAVKTAETRRRAVEAALVLRNLVIEGGPKGLHSVRTAGDYLFIVLGEVLADNTDTELSLCIIDIAEPFAHLFVLALPRYDIPVDQRPVDQRLYPLLAQLANSNDRAEVVAAFTFLGALALHPHNQTVFAYQPPTISAHNVSQYTGPRATYSSAVLSRRALELIHLEDAELLLPVLDYLYQYTLQPPNASSVLLRSDLRDIFRILLSRVKEGASQESVEYEVDLPDVAQNKLRGKVLRDALIVQYPILATPQQNAPDGADIRLDDRTMESIKHESEPDRGRSWMQALFEADPEGEITQVALWKAYQAQFDVYADEIEAGTVAATVSAQEIIKLSSEVFPFAHPKAYDDEAAGKRFVVRGIKVRPQFQAPDPVQDAIQRRWQCRWSGCQYSTPFSSGVELYMHISETHANASEWRQGCQFGSCDFTSTTQRGLLFHVRTHVPPANPLDPSGPTTSVLAADSLDSSTRTFTDSVTRPQVSNQEAAVGVGFLASLTLRNLARAVASASVLHGNVLKEKYFARNHAGDLNGSDDIDQSEQNRLHGFLSSHVADPEDVDTGPKTMPDDVELDETQLLRAISALTSISEEVTRLAATNQALSPYLVETLNCVDKVRGY